MGESWKLSNTVDRPVEQATAAPGEQRDVCPHTRLEGGAGRYVCTECGAELALTDDVE